MLLTQYLDTTYFLITWAPGYFLVLQTLRYFLVIQTPRCTRLETDERNSLAGWKPDTCDKKLPYACSGPLGEIPLLMNSTLRNVPYI